MGVDDMKKIGRRRIRQVRSDGKPVICIGCGRQGVFHATFEDCWGRLTVTLCDECSDKNYEDLGLQTRIEWPIKK